MTWQLHPKELEAVTGLPASKRYEYWVKKVADWEQVWSLWSSDGWALTADDEGRELVPVWPHRDYAAACVGGNWSGTMPKELSLDEWIERWIPGMVRDGRRVAVFPTPDDQDIRVSAERVERDLKAELSRMH